MGATPGASPSLAMPASRTPRGRTGNEKGDPSGPPSDTSARKGPAYSAASAGMRVVLVALLAAAFFAARSFIFDSTCSA